jgi:hypothetical protein
MKIGAWVEGELKFQIQFIKEILWCCPIIGFATKHYISVQGLLTITLSKSCSYRLLNKSRSISAFETSVEGEVET